MWAFLFAFVLFALTVYVAGKLAYIRGEEEGYQKGYEDGRGE